MKLVHYAALEPPRVALALQSQAWEGLKPFGAYLAAAWRAARARQVRHRVGWTRPETSHVLHLRPLDSLFEWDPAEDLLRVEGLPAGTDPDTLPPRLVVDFADLVEVRRVVRRGDSVLVGLDRRPDDGATINWGRHTVRLEPAPGPAAPRQVFDAGCQALALLRADEDAGRLRVVVAGEVAALHDAGGAPLPCRAISPTEGLATLRAPRGPTISFADSLQIAVPALPETPVLLGDNGVRFAWEEPPARRQRGEWVQLVPLDEGGEETVDPRLAFCEDGVHEVRVARHGGGWDKIRVLRGRRESYQLCLERLPPEGAVLQLPINLNTLRRQREAVEGLCHGPLPAQRGLLRLLEDPDRTRWPAVRPADVGEWYLLRDPPQGAPASGTHEQRTFVRKALATPDFAFLEGPPGSGKTHAICELVLQSLARGERVLLCSTTHVAVDNVLERLVGRFEHVEAVRIGDVDKVDERVRACQLGERVDALAQAWCAAGAFDANDDLRATAEAVVLASANLTCGTTTGILAHPWLRAESDAGGRTPFDVLIVDEASKTTFQEFLVPARLARRWIIVGDVRQLPPFTEAHDLEASLEDLGDGAPGEAARRLGAAHQRALLLLFRLTRNAALPGRTRWVLTESDEVFDRLRDELAARRADTPDRWPEVARIVAGRPRSPATAGYGEIPLEAMERGDPAALRLYAADWLLVPPGLVSACERWLPADAVWVREPSDAQAVLPYRRGHWRARHGRWTRPVRDGRDVLPDVAAFEAHHRRFLAERTWAAETAWRLGRLHQLSQSRGERARARLDGDLDWLLPHRPEEAEWCGAAVADLRDVGMRSLLEALRLGRVDHRVRRRSALTDGLPDEVWRDRAVLLSYQHRMHPDISAFPREAFYEQRALKDADTLPGRDARVGWRFGGFPARRTWIDVAGREERGVNRAEIDVLRRVLTRWRAECRGPRADGRPWEIACLAFYNKQELAIRDMLRELTGQNRQTRFELPHTEVVCATVDRFQGREADLVLLSLRNTSRPGHIDSPNRLNVAITRARHLLLIVGARGAFVDCGVEELEALAAETPSVDFREIPSGRRTAARPDHETDGGDPA